MLFFQGVLGVIGDFFYLLSDRSLITFFGKINNQTRKHRRNEILTWH